MLAHLVVAWGALRASLAPVKRATRLSLPEQPTLTGMVKASANSLLAMPLSFEKTAPAWLAHLKVEEVLVESPTW